MREAGEAPVRLTQGNAREAAYWTPAQLIAHHTVNGCNLQPGDLLGSGTLSGRQPDEAGSLLELTLGGKQPITLPNGERRTFLEDGDTLTLRGWCERAGAVRIGLGEVRRHRAASGRYTGRLNFARAASAASRAWQPSRWSLTRPMACMKAYMVVGPTKLQPRLRRSLESACDAGEVGMALTASCVRRFGPTRRLGFEAPDVGRQRAEFHAQFEHALGVVDRGADLACVAHDAGIAQQALDVGLVKRRHPLGVELGEGAPEGLALVQDGEPGQARLEAFQTQFLEQPALVGDRPAPFVIVVVPVQRCGLAPRAARGADVIGKEALNINHIGL